MSRTYEICCTQCMESLWVGQDRHLYGGDRLEHLAIFLHAHLNHPLVFCDSQSTIATECEELSDAMDETMQRISDLGKST